MQLVKFRPPRIGMVLVLSATVLHLVLPLSIGIRLASPVAGAVVGMLGFLLMMWSWWIFRKQDIAICPIAPTARLLTSGIYRHSRNPMYVGMVSMLFGLAMVVGTLPFYAAAISYFAVFNFVFCPYEEEKLSATFGQAYLDYKSSVRRWL